MKKSYISIAVATSLATMFIGCGGAETSSNSVETTATLLDTQRDIREYSTQRAEEVTISIGSIERSKRDISLANMYAKVYLNYIKDDTVSTEKGLKDYITTVKLDKNGEYHGYIQVPTNVKTIYAQIPVVGIIEIPVNGEVVNSSTVERAIDKKERVASPNSDTWNSSNDDTFKYLLKSYSIPDGELERTGGIFADDLVDTDAKNVPVFDYNDEAQRNTILDSLKINQNMTSAYPNMFSETDDETISLAKEGEVFLTFYYEVANFRSSFGYFAYDGEQINEDGSTTTLPSLPSNRNELAQMIKTDAKITFAQSSSQSTPIGSNYSGDVAWGDTLNIGKYSAGTKFIFFLLPDSWTKNYGGKNLEHVRAVTSTRTTKGLDGFICTMSKFNIEYPSSGDEADFTYIGDESPDGYKIPDHKHTLNMWATGPKGLDSDADGKYDRTLILGFEDLQRNLDRYQGKWYGHDFLDLVFGVSTNPNNALETNQNNTLPTIVDSDGDGVDDGLDEFPTDPKRAYTSHYPSEDGVATLMFEDKYPSEGDMDLNDLVVELNISEVKDANLFVKDINMNVDVVASGANYDNGFGIKLDVSPSNIESVTIDGQNVPTISDGDGFIIDIVSNIKSKLGYTGNGSYYNTQVSSDKSSLFNELTFSGDRAYIDNPESGNGLHYNLKVTFKSSVDSGMIGLPPYNPFIKIVNPNSEIGEIDVHMPNYEGTVRSASKYRDNENFISTSDNLPWAILVPSKFNYPLEAIHVKDAYNNYSAWVREEFKEYTNWWEDSSTNYNQNYTFQK